MLIPFLTSWGFTFLLCKSLPLSQQGSACMCPGSVEFSTVCEPGPDRYSVPSFFSECKCSPLAWTQCRDRYTFTWMCFSKCVTFSLHDERDLEPYPECPQQVGFIIRFLTCRLYLAQVDSLTMVSAWVWCFLKRDFRWFEKPDWKTGEQLDTTHM